MSILPESRDFVIQELVSVQNNTIQYGPTGIDVLREASSPGAMMDSRDHYDRRCFPGTRDQYITDITNWATAPDDISSLIYWMKGSAGVGKSAIAQTCAEELWCLGNLGAAFFFSVKKYDDPTRLFTTLAHQLSTKLPNYRAIIDEKISRDKTLVQKKISSQFHSLIVEPLQELEKQGKKVNRRVIFIDGLDECADKDAQMEIINIVVSSAHSRSTPFRWAIFSREEPHIVSTFASPSVSSHCYSVFLPISREADGEIELYLRGGFKNILRRRNFLHLSSSWPTDEDIRKLVRGAAGLFAHSTTVLRFIDGHSFSGFKETLEAILTSKAKFDTQPISPYAELDGLYTLILQRVPEDILLATKLFLSRICTNGFEYGLGWSTIQICNQIGISETTFQSICHHLQAIMLFHEPSKDALDEATHFAHHRYQHCSFAIPCIPNAFQSVLWNVHGNFHFYHKSFYDFLSDPARSSSFCVTVPAIREKVFDCYIQQQLHYASSFTDSHLNRVKLVFPTRSLGQVANISASLCHDTPEFAQFVETVPFSSLQKLSQVDHRKFLLGDIAGIMHSEEDSLVVSVAGHPGCTRFLQHTMFECLHSTYFDPFEPVKFLMMVDKLERAGAIKPYHPRPGSGYITSFLNTFSRRKPHGKNCGHYQLGCGDKSVIWYWEFDTEERYFHEFRTVSYTEAMAFYKAEKFTMWKDVAEGGDSDEEIDQEDGEQAVEDACVEEGEDDARVEEPAESMESTEITEVQGHEAVSVTVRSGGVKKQGGGRRITFSGILYCFVWSILFYAYIPLCRHITS
ncbi:hypothetical protein D9756_006360 [Leucocoprinus leucothites]|uniref:Nephrocystin 3-like N-terminal domain-containing protein n=1 Tax=Leucocoprinus leucothites TaxID=201217 RepID=A0A8H5LHE4_9AGAR|nr:hypothetical protein D9756_006360 [Leucoagaricus leucothites]